MYLPFLTEHHAMEAYGGSCITPRILDLGWGIMELMCFTVI